MAISTSTGRVVESVIKHPQFQKIKGAKARFCKVNDDLMTKAGNKIIKCIQNKNWKCVYEENTAMRRHIEIQEESCK